MILFHIINRNILSKINDQRRLAIAVHPGYLRRGLFRIIAQLHDTDGVVIILVRLFLIIEAVQQRRGEEPVPLVAVQRFLD